MVLTAEIDMVELRTYLEKLIHDRKDFMKQFNVYPQPNAVRGQWPQKSLFYFVEIIGDRGRKIEEQLKDTPYVHLFRTTMRKTALEGWIFGRPNMYADAIGII